MERNENYESRDRIQRRLKGRVMDPNDQLPALPPPEPFVPYATIFTLDPPNENPRSMVRCLNCGVQYPLKDLQDGELNDDQCPSCKRWALDYWKDKPHRKVPNV